jgi:hypothetical protein
LPYSGTIGHVAHGKSTVVKAISGVHTVRFKTEIERNITIKLGYANAKVFVFFIRFSNVAMKAVLDLLVINLSNQTRHPVFHAKGLDAVGKWN